MKDLKKDFPIFKYNKDLVFLDSAASTQKPEVVIEAIKDFESRYYANIHRGIYKLSAKATALYDEARERVKKFINAKYFEEIIFTKNATESINLVATTLAKDYFQDGDEIIISALEHHANIVPWQLIQSFKKIKIKVIPIDDAGNIDISAYKALFTDKTKLVSITHVSNVLGNIVPIKEIISYAKKKNVLTLIDGCQAVNSFPVDVQDLGCDFYVFSSHKLYGPTGIGVLYGKKDILNKLPPYQGGGDMIKTVSFEKTEYNDLPYKFEAGTPCFTQAYGLSKAIEYLQNLGMQNVFNHSQDLLDYAQNLLHKTFKDDIKIFGSKDNKVGIISFILKDNTSSISMIHPHDIATFLDEKNIAIRTGHHCAEPLITRLKVPATARISFGVYNDFDDIDKCVKTLKEIKSFFKNGR
ncbi:MAG: putative cysteine desulfurase [Candidatus Anoxychlamydiales bacterium]|nr:putative cysteine desulfurase [Candidatus Anoxychlamydiales bacterium]